MCGSVRDVFLPFYTLLSLHQGGARDAVDEDLLALIEKHGAASSSLQEDGVGQRNIYGRKG